jgi:hypothetical protein
MKLPWGWALIAAGVLLDAAVLLLPLSPFPLIQMTLDRDYYNVRRGYEHFLEKGKWEAGDPGFALAREQYMQDVVSGRRPELAPEFMPGASVLMFLLAPEESLAGTPETREVYVVYSNHQAHSVEGSTMKALPETFDKPYATLVSVALLLLGTVLVYSGLERVVARVARGSNQVSAEPGEIALSRAGAS